MKIQDLFEAGPSDTEVLRHLRALDDWFVRGGTEQDGNQSFLAACTFLNRLSPYKPYKGTLYRAQFSSKKLEVGKTYELNSMARPLASFTTSLDVAHEFRDTLSVKTQENTYIVELLSNEHQIASGDWVMRHARKLYSEYKVNRDHPYSELQRDIGITARGLIYETYEDEKEVVVMFKNKTYRVKVLG